MSSNVGHNSLVMAMGTAASRLTGQVRTILLAAAVGTTGLAANAYQAGSQIPQVIYTLVSGGIFNAVLVPQIVRTLKSKDAQEQLNKLITFAIVLLLAVTGIVAALAPALTRLYVNGGSDMVALSTAFTFWCVPQIFFYGLYTVIGQILAAKDHFGVYAWSSVGANVISCIGFTAFILMFGKADKQPLGFWTSDKIVLTAGAWTLGVAFQALALFLPLFKLGIHYRPKFGIHGIGLRQMGPVAAWGLSIVVVDQIVTIINTRVSTSAPLKAHEAYGASLYNVAGNATYQNAFTIYILPYSLIATSVATAIFPQIAKLVAAHNIDSARNTLSQALRNVWLIMCFFTAVFIVIPAPISLALLPSISVKEALLMSGPLIGLAIGLPLSSAYLIIQRTFYAFEDGYHPFIFVVLQSGIQVAVLLVGTIVIREDNWVTLLGYSITIGYVLSFPVLVLMLRKRFEGRIDGAKLTLTFAKGTVAAIVAIALGLLLRYPVYAMFGSYLHGTSGHMNWIQAVGSCAVLAILVTLFYAGTLWAFRTPELVSFIRSTKAKVYGIAGKSAAKNLPENAADAGTTGASKTDTSKANAGATRGRNTTDHGSAPHHLAAEAHGPSPRTVRSSTLAAPQLTAPSFPPSSLNQYDILSDFDSDRDGAGQETHNTNSADKNNSSSNNAETSIYLTPVKHVSPHTTFHANSTTPNARIRRAQTSEEKPEDATLPSRTGTAMKPKPQDVVNNRYMLLSPLRQSDGLEAWQANDTVLDRKEQLFLITDKSSITQVEAIASSLALSRSSRFTKVSLMQRVQGIPLLVTQLESGIALNDCLGAASGKRSLNFESIRFITMQVAEGLRQLLSDGICLPTLTTDMIRIGEQGVEICDAPVSPLFIDLLRTPKLDPERTAVYQVASLAYALLTNHTTSNIANFDLEQLPAGTPEELQLICTHGLNVVYLNDASSISAMSLSELVALLAPATAAQNKLAASKLYESARQAHRESSSMTSSSAITIEHVALRPVGEAEVLQIPDTLGTTGTTAMPDDMADSTDGASQANNTEDSQDSIDSKETNEPGTTNNGAGHNTVTANAAARTFRSVISGTNAGTRSRHGNATTRSKQSAASLQPTSQHYNSKAELDDTTGSGVNLDFHDIAAAEMAQAFKPVDAYADDSWFSDFSDSGSRSSRKSNPASRNTYRNVTNSQPYQGFDFAKSTNTNGSPAGASSAGTWNTTTATNGNEHSQGSSATESLENAAHPQNSQAAKDELNSEQDMTQAFSNAEDDALNSLPLRATGMNSDDLDNAGKDSLAFQATSRIPVFNKSGMPVEPGDESARALREERYAQEQPRQTPPSFTPASQAKSTEEFSDSPALKHKTAIIVTVILVALLLVAALGFAALNLSNHAGPNGSKQQSSQSESAWPKMDLDNVPFKGNKDEEGAGNGTKGQKKPKPAPAPQNTTPYTIDSRNFIENSDGQQGYGYYMHLNQPEPVSRFVVSIKSSGGNAQLIANTNKPTSGQKVADFSFDQSGTTEVKLKQPVTSQDFLLWVPIDSLPNNQLYIVNVQFY